MADKDKKEVPLTLQKYLTDSKGHMTALGSSDDIHKFQWFIENGVIVTTDHPDAFVKVGNDILIIEHFAIDGYEEKEHVGSLATYNERAIHTKLEKQELINGSKHITAQLGVKNSYQQFLDNCCRRFEHHYQQIELYKQHLVDEQIADAGSRYTVCFLMDEVSPIGTLTVDDEGRICPVCLGYSKEFLDYFEKKTKVDWIVSAVIKPDESSSWWRYHPYFFSRNDIAECRGRIVNYARLQFLESDPFIAESEIEVKDRFARVGDILHMEKGKMPSSTTTTPKEGFLPYVDIKAFEKGTVDRYASVQNATLCDEGDLLIVCDGSRSGLTGRAIKGVVGSTLSKVNADGLTTEYLRYFLQSKYELLNSRKKGTGTPHLNAELLKESLVYTPETREQERIVARIEELFSELDAGVDTLQKIKQQLSVYRQAVLKDAFACFAEKEPISQCSAFVTSGSRGWAKYYADTGARFVRITDLTRYGIELQDKEIQRVLLPENAEGKRSRLVPNDVLISITADLGSIALVPETIGEAYINQHIAMVRFNDPALGKFMAWYLRSDYGQKELLRNKRGNGKMGLGLDDIRQTMVPIVDRNEASKTVETIEKRLSVCDSIQQTVDKALQQSAAMRQSILKQAFEGGL